MPESAHFARGGGPELHVGLLSHAARHQDGKLHPGVKRAEDAQL